jgi:TIGR03009 family protein
MTNGQLQGVVEYIRHVTEPGGHDDATDGQLLELFIRHGDESAFTVLLRRHAALVLTVCRRVNEVYGGTLKYLKPDMAVLEMHKRGKPDTVEKYVRVGRLLYEYRPKEKVVQVFELPPGTASRELQMLLPSPVAVTAGETKRLYETKLLKMDQWYVYIGLKPRIEDARDFGVRGRLVLNKSTQLPRQWWFEQENGNEVTWDVVRIEENVPLSKKDFREAALVPAGWKLQRVPRLADPPPPKDPPPPEPTPAP